MNWRRLRSLKRTVSNEKGVVTFELEENELVNHVMRASMTILALDFVCLMIAAISTQGRFEVGIFLLPIGFCFNSILQFGGKWSHQILKIDRTLGEYRFTYDSMPRKILSGGVGDLESLQISRNNSVYIRPAKTSRIKRSEALTTIGYFDNHNDAEAFANEISAITGLKFTKYTV